MNKTWYALLAIAMVMTATVVMMGASSGAGSPSYQNVTSTVIVSYYVAISMSTNLSTGIDFGDLNVSTTDNPGNNNTSGNNGNSSYWINVSSNSNVPVDICISSNESLTSGSDEINNTGNYTINSTILANLRDTGLDPELNNSYYLPLVPTWNITREGVDLASSTAHYLNFRFWLDVPTGTPAGTYANNVSFKGIRSTGTGSDC